MTDQNCIASCCRCCGHYLPEGRRGGHCQQLGVLVQGSWKTCSLARPPFKTPWKKLADIRRYRQENLVT